MNLGLDERVAFIAGSSRGIGLAIARAFLREGAKVIITGRNADALDQAAATLQSAFSPERILPLPGDMTDPQDISNAFAKAISVFDDLHAVVANVGSGKGKRGWELNTEDWNIAMKTNLLGSMALTSTALEYLTKRGAGNLTLIASITASEALSAPIPYSAAKAAILNAMKNLSRAVGQNGVRVNAVSPGNILFPGGSWEEKLSAQPEFFEKYIRQEVPLQRFGTPEEVADAVVFLASERAAFITGSCLTVDGGQTRAL